MKKFDVYTEYKKRVVRGTDLRPRGVCDRRAKRYLVVSYPGAA